MMSDRCLQSQPHATSFPASSLLLTSHYAVAMTDVIGTALLNKTGRNEVREASCSVDSENRNVVPSSLMLWKAYE
jgi:hypothetical protein